VTFAGGETGGRFTPVLLLLTALTGGATLLGPVLWALNPFGIARQLFVLEQFLPVELALALAFVALRVAVRTGRRTTQLVLLAGAIASLATGLALAIYFGSGSALFIKADPTTLTLSLALVGLSILGLALSGSRAMVLLVLGMLAFGYLSQFIGGIFATAPVRPERYIVYLVFGGDGFLGRALEVMITSVVIYLIFGAAYEVAGGTAALDALANRLAGRGSGVAIKATVISSALFGVISGSATSNVVTSGAFTISAMTRMGVSPAMAGGIEAVSSTLGQVTPPVLGAAAFLMADLTGIPYGQIALATALPAAICYITMLHQGTWIGRKTAPKPGDALPLTAEPLQLRHALHLLPVVTILGLMLIGDRMTALAGIAGAGVALLVGLGLHGPRETFARARRVIATATPAIANLIVAGSALGVVVGVLNITGLDVSLTLAIGRLGEINLLFALLLTALAAFLLGTGMSTSGVYIVVGTLLAPGLVKLGVPMMAAHLFVLYWAMLSMITPPIAFAALAASSISGASFSATAWASMRYGWMVFVVPFAFVYQPALVLTGSGWTIAMVLAAAGAALWTARGLVADWPLAQRLLALLGVALGTAALFTAGAEPDAITLALLVGSAAVGIAQVVWERGLAKPAAA
jgi:TRAP transporter 4TM/12TM fusion protein